MPRTVVFPSCDVSSVPQLFYLTFCKSCPLLVAFLFVLSQDDCTGLCNINITKQKLFYDKFHWLSAVIKRTVICDVFHPIPFFLDAIDNNDKTLSWVVESFRIYSKCTSQTGGTRCKPLLMVWPLLVWYYQLQRPEISLLLQVSLFNSPIRSSSCRKSRATTQRTKARKQETDEIHFEYKRRRKWNKSRTCSCLSRWFLFPSNIRYD